MPADGPPRPLVTVVVPVFGAAGGLGRCLAALGAQTWPRDRFEVIVVDNGASPRAAESMAALPGARMVREERPSSYAARNRGVAEARGEVIAFTDDDCVPAPDWLERGVAALDREPRTGMVVGRVDLFYADPARPTAVELYESVSAFRQREYVERWRFGATANVLTPRSVLREVGGFDEDLRSLGDVEWGRRVHAAGFLQVYADDVRVGHPARHTLADFRRRAARMAGGFRTMSAKGGWPLLSMLRDAPLGLPPLGHLLGFHSRGSLKGFVPRVKVLLLLAYIVSIRCWELLRLSLGGTPGR